MNHLVPDFHVMDLDDSIHAHSRLKKPSTDEDELMELLWQNGQVVLHSQNQRPLKKTSDAADLPTEKEIRPTTAEHLFIHEDELASWLQYPLDVSSFDRDFCSDLIYSPPPPPPPAPITTTQPKSAAELRPPPPENPPRQHNFVHFSRLAARDSATVVESNEPPALGRERESRPPVNERGGNTPAVGGTCELTVTSSPGSSRTSFSGETRPLQEKPPPPAAADDRKRKGREGDRVDFQSEDFDLEAKKQARGLSSTKRSRAAEVHNLSERRRRDRINEKMRVLQELIPRCNKSDKASMLDEAIEYLKSLQLQVQMMSMGHGMIPMMYHPASMQQYMPKMGMGLGIGMDMGLTRPMIPYLSISATPNSAARFPLPPGTIHVPATDQPTNSTIGQSQNHLRLPKFANPYQQYLSFCHSQLPLPHNQVVVPPIASKASTSKNIGNPP